MKTILKSLIPLFLSASFFLSCNVQPNENEEDENQELSTIHYLADESKFPNPERGFYKHTSCNLGLGTGLLFSPVLKSYRETKNITLILRLFYLKNFKNSPLSQNALDDFDKDMASLREAGIKCILRFAYSEDPDEEDAPLAIIEQHLDQLKPHFEKNKDVIAFFQAGFIGAWGEWYFSSNGLNNPAGRNAVLKKILQVLPEDRIVQVRTPGYKQNYFNGRKTPLNQSEAFLSQEIARVGHHNDCFLASPNDYGTYYNVAEDKAYLNAECLYVPIGGETCPPLGISPADGIKAQDEMRYLRWTYLNEDYYKGVNDTWIPGGYMDNIIRGLGYRYELISGEYSSSVKKGGEVVVKINLKNTGYAPLYNKRSVEIILISNDSNEKYKVSLDEDPRFWQPDEENLIDVKIGLPDDITEGEYKLYLNMPDEAEKLSEIPYYSIRFSNENVWNSSTGFNDLNHILTIESASSKVTFNGNLIFQHY